MSSSISESNLIESESKCYTPLSSEALKALNTRSTLKGLFQLFGHLAILGISGYLWGTNLGHNWAIAIPAVIVYGFGFAAMFAPMHECSHRTAFENNLLNDVVCWIAGLLSFYNGAFYRRYHKWHHRYTQLFDKDPELSDPLPQTLVDYLITMSGITWWWGKLKTHFRVALGQLDDYPYISEEARAGVILSVRSQLSVYAVAIAISFYAHQPWFVVYWLLPLAVGQPILRMILLSEHTGCTHDDNPFTNTRSTKTLFPLQFLMWNMPFHAEHHLYPSIPFHQLPAAHQQLREQFTFKDQGYIEVNYNFAKELV
ncbi:fatty acid desaturase family protein [Cyanobacteria bacterium FACHB-63]|nr:fatty acid desaturase family protein [Cyanobacteria bacterium FACHB-63]